ncbi:MAG: 23S rRNA pseudouridine1911/1915/1917 synthase [Lentisphaeria bacterium]|jgi:23S rRNA pseudouridine1911/1915/1917 synthase
MTSLITLNARVPSDRAGCRFDQVAADLFPDYSRSRIQSWIKAGDLTIDGRSVKPNVKLAGGEHLALETQLQSEGEWQAEDIALDVIYEDASLMVINKPVGLVVHPGAGNWQGTLLNALLYRYPELRQLPRAGIVHRLDKDTSGLMVVARTLESQTSLVSQLQNKSVRREYQAVCRGELQGKGIIDQPIGRHPVHRTKMAVLGSGGKHAVTHYEVLESFAGLSHAQLKLETGRTHQIRVHMAHMGFPLIGDALYGRQFSSMELKTQPLSLPLEHFSRQALHAKKLGLIHPLSSEYCQWSSELPQDFAELLAYISEHF